MALFNLSHTLARLNVIKKKLDKSVEILSYIAMFVFISYYVYLFIQNLDSPFYLLVYSILIFTIVSLFLVEIFIKEKEKILQNEKRQSLEKKRKFKFIIKTIKYVAKFSLISLALIETITDFDRNLSSTINVISFIFLIAQILFEFITNFVVKQIDYIKLSFKLDYENSKALQVLLRSYNKDKKSEEEAIEKLGGSIYTDLEEKMIQELKEDALEYEENVQKRREMIKKITKDAKEKEKELKKKKKKN